jgi:hypothetical protein
LVDVGIHYKHVEVTRSNIGPESVKKCGDVENEPISGKKLREMPLSLPFQTPLYFIKIPNCIYKVH